MTRREWGPRGQRREGYHEGITYLCFVMESQPYQCYLDSRPGFDGDSLEAGLETLFGRLRNGMRMYKDAGIFRLCACLY